MKYLIVGGAGFIGSYIIDALLQDDSTVLVRIYDNFSSGKRWHLAGHIHDSRLEILHYDIYDAEIFEAAKDIDVTILLAANPDIAKAVTEPDIDFKEGTVLTQITLEAIRKAKCPRLLYASGSGVYGDTGDRWVSEAASSMEPISTYGASKLGCEALISSYCHMFGLRATAFRFGNVVGGRQTHGVAYDFIRRLQLNPVYLEILGDGSQSKPYVHVFDVVKALRLMLSCQFTPYEVVNVAPNDFTTVTEIAHIVIDELGIPKESCEFRYSGGTRGWKGDVPIVRLDTSKIRALGWGNSFSSTGAVRKSVLEMISNLEFLYRHA
jgi:UDP-glucose 4-epimerase